MDDRIQGPLLRQVCRRAVLRGFITGSALAAGGLLTAYPRSRPAAAAAAPASTLAAKGGTLRLIQNSDVLPKNLHTLYFPNYGYMYNVCEPLVRQDWRANLRLTPVLAESFDFGADKTTLNFKLRKGVKFHSGRELGAEDVKANLLRVREERVGSQWRNYSNDITDIQTPDHYTITLKFKEPRPGIWDMFESLPIIDKDSFADLEAGKNVVGTGPFKWSKWTPNDQLTIVRNDNYWQEGPPALDAINIRIVPDAQALAINLESGAADLAISPAYADIPRLRSNQNLRVVSSESGSENFYLGADLLQPPLEKQKVRQALNWAIDRQRIVDSVLFGVGRVKCVPWGPNNPAWNDDQASAYKFDLEKAKALLAEAGVSGGFDVTLTTNTAQAPHRGMAQVIQSDLAKIGVRVKIQELEANRWLELLQGRKFRGLWLGPTGCGNFNPGSITSLLFPFRVGANASNYESQKYADLARQAQTVADPAKAKAVYQDLTQLLLDESFVMPITIQRTTWAMSSKVQGFDYTAMEVTHLVKTSLSK